VGESADNVFPYLFVAASLIKFKLKIEAYVFDWLTTSP